jgi:hypothetical protein
MNTPFRNTVHARGDICIKVKDAKTGKLLRKIEIRNTITFLFADVVLELLAQRAADPTAVNNSIYTLRVGTGSTAPTRADTNLGNPVFGMILTDPNKITGLPGELEITSTLESGDANGNTLSEAGLFTKGPSTGSLDAPGATGVTPRLLARQIHPGIPKTSALTLEYSWKLSITA